MTATVDEKYILRALRLAEKGRGKTSPNPMVGAVIVKNNRIIGEGYHKKAGANHAEIMAIKKAGRDVKGATLYINLEPCCHQGRTGPCTERIVETGMKRVVFSLKDPNPLVNGKGAARLRRAGIKVSSGLFAEKARRQNEVYVKFIRTGRPFIILKLAQTIDGRIATIDGDSKWITGVRSRKLVHRLRAEYDAVAVGRGTVTADDPHLTVRSISGKNPYRIILSGRPDFPESINLFKNNDDARTILATSRHFADKYRTKNLIVWKIKQGKDGLALDDFLEKAADFGINSMMIEGGARLATSFIKAGLIDKYYIFIAPMIIGSGKDAVGNLDIRSITEGVNLDVHEVDISLRPDILLVGYPEVKS
jgi:diaminohydroxyphosphoribosylaminopyrimidine deaminase/5-amino-6-(5-phosphoribosylamino)uracil reductase